MALTLGQKSVRVLKFLQGLALPRVRSGLAAHGFQQEDYDDGWASLRKASGSSIAMPPAVPVDSSLYLKLDAWENIWFPIVQASLSRHYPDLARQVFLNLSQTEGPAVSVSVGILLERLELLAKDASTPAQAATALLQKRGLTPAVLGEAQSLLKQIGTLPPVATSEPTPTAEQVQQAEDEMWAWYLEWSAIAQRAIADRRLLRGLGFLAPRGSKDAADDDEEAPAEASAKSA